MQGIFYNDLQTSYIPHILKELYIEKVYAPYIENRKDLVIIDCGANVGLFSLYASPYAKQIYALEPAREHLEVFTHMLIHNGITNVKIVPKALSHVNKQMMFFHSNNKTMYSLNRKVDDTGQSEVVQTITLDKLLEEIEEEHIDFMKLDVEGAEMEIVGSKEFAETSKRIDMMVVEYHVWSGRNVSQLTTALMDYGFSVSPISADATLFVAKRIK